ncbi:hotdog family protein [Bremerella sp. T1]|uniref:beta-hydroxyacyl-ACP dehydratase n=1 Tax=Bremerella sp. TYQ1 TaxID=3119568 RepID=UPI001CCF896E|nr:beta-hydroxyacyl-ACP dehydratase [Bremerella volcania]UBM34242.1 beta-hydroxyacyl-ACP dehydratase [Bremerella volcania]
MRWFWIDKFIEFESGKSAKSVKCVSLAEDHLHDHFLFLPVMPHSLVIEGIAQTGGLLAGEVYDFRERVVLAKVAKATFHCSAHPGDQLTYSVTMNDIRENGAYISATSHKGDQLHAEVEMFFAHLSDKDHQNRELFFPADFLAMLRLLKLYDVGKAKDGSPLQPPEYMLEAECTAARAPSTLEPNP